MNAGESPGVEICCHFEALAEAYSMPKLWQVVGVAVRCGEARHMQPDGVLEIIVAGAAL